MALTLPKAVSPSSILDSTELVVITGAVSSTSVIFTIISCESFKLASLTVTVAVYSSLVSKSGADTKVITPVDESICNSFPEIV